MSGYHTHFGVSKAVNLDASRLTRVSPSTHLWIEVLVAPVEGHKQDAVVLPEDLLGAVAVVDLQGASQDRRRRALQRSTQAATL
jgi:hypothetical protein